jgi:hypothetical protein
MTTFRRSSSSLYALLFKSMRPNPHVRLDVCLSPVVAHSSIFVVDPKDLKKKKKVDSKEAPQNVEVKLEQAKYDAILKEAAVRQEKRSKEEVLLSPLLLASFLRWVSCGYDRKRKSTRRRVQLRWS